MLYRPTIIARTAAVNLDTENCISSSSSLVVANMIALTLQSRTDLRSHATPAERRFVSKWAAVKVSENGLTWIKKYPDPVYEQVSCFVTWYESKT